MKRHTVIGKAAAAAVALTLAAVVVPAQAEPGSGRPGWFREDFGSATLDQEWTVLGEDEGAWSLAEPRGALTLTTRDANLYEGDNRPVNVLLRDAPTRDFALTTRLSFAPRADYEQAGLLLWAGEDDYVQLSYSHQGGLALLAGVETEARFSTELLENTVGDELQLRITRRGDRLDFAYRGPDTGWQRVGQPVRSTTDYPQVGLFANASGSNASVPARFDSLHATPTPRVREPRLPALPPDSGPVEPADGQQRVPYQNPVQEWTSGDPATADPTVARGPDGWFYLVGSESEYSYSPYHAMPIYRSRDLVNWDYLTDVFPEPADYPDWVEDTQTDRIDFWAPDIAFHDGRVYVYYGATQKSDPEQPTNDKAIGVAVADSVTGPFIDRGEPLVTGSTFRAIDQQVFTDTDGQRYLYWGSAFYPVLAQRLSEDGLDVVAEVHQVLPSHQGSAYVFDTEQPLRPNLENLVEAPWVVKRGQWYYMFYSGPNCCGPGANYTVAAARSTSPLGPFDKLETNPILAGDERVLAPGHNAVATDDAGQDWMVYHAMDAEQNPTGDASRRNLHIDKIEWRDGWPVVDGPTSDPQTDGPIITGGTGGIPPLPGPVSDLTADEVTESTVGLSWAPADDDVEVTGYAVYRDGIEVERVSAQSRQSVLTGLEPCTRSAWSVRPIAADGRLGDAGGRLELTTAGCPEGSVSGRTIDRETQGDWRGSYGALGYTVAGDASLTAPGVTVTTPTAPFTWVADSTERRALQRADGDGRLAASWFGGSVPVSVAVADGTRRVSLHVLDWDTPGQRRQSITVTDQQGRVLDELTGSELAAFDQGVVISWEVTGQVTFTTQVEAGANAVVSAVYVDAP